MRSFDYTHTVLFEETNLLGNVYFVNHLRWQGQCREMFLKRYAPTVLDDLEKGLALVTTRCSCDYFEELKAFDEVTIRMMLREIGQSRLTLGFEYHSKGVVVATGFQQIACMRKENDRMQAAPVPLALRESLNL